MSGEPFGLHPGMFGPDPDPRRGRLFREARPWDFILFARNVETPDQVRRLTASLRAAVDFAEDWMKGTDKLTG